MNCEYCGNDLKTADKNCPNCGARVNITQKKKSESSRPIAPTPIQQKPVQPTSTPQPASVQQQPVTYSSTATTTTTTHHSSVKKPWYKKWWVWVAIVIMLAAFGSSTDGDSTENTTTPNNSEVIVQEAAALGTVQESKTFSMKVKSAKEATELTGESGINKRTPKEGTKYVVAEVEFKNVSDKNAYLTYYDFKVVASNGVEYKAVFGPSDKIYLGLSETMIPGVTLTRNVVFEIPKEYEFTAFNLQYGATGYDMDETKFLFKLK